MVTSVLGTPEIERQLAHPFPGPFGSGDVQNLVDQETIAALIIFDAENVAGDFDQVALQVAVIPFFEDVVEFIVVQSAKPRAAIDRLRRSTACRRTRSRCGPF